jgi:uncharacterized membrane protein YjfL (UPF0719 family)
MEFLAFFDALWRLLPSALVVLFYVAALWWTFDKWTKFDDREEIVGKKNVAYLLQRLGLAAAQIIAMYPVISDFDPENFLGSIGWLAAEGLWVFVALVVARWFVDWLILPKINNQELLLQRNLAVGITEFGAYIGIGFLLAGSLTGGATSNGLAFASTVVFYLLGLLFVTAVFWLYEWVTPYDLRTLLKEGSVSAGIELAGVFVASALAVRVGVAGDFESWPSAFAWFFVTAAVAIALLGLVWFAVLGVSIKIWKIPKSQLREAPDLTISIFRVGVMILVGVLMSRVLAVA